MSAPPRDSTIWRLEGAYVQVADRLNGFDLRFNTLEGRFERLEDKFDSKFEALEAKFDAKFNALETTFDAKFNALENKFDAKLGAMGTKFDANHASMDAKFDRKFDNLGRTLNAMQWKMTALIVATWITAVAAFFFHH